MNILHIGINLPNLSLSSNLKVLTNRSKHA